MRRAYVRFVTSTIDGVSGRRLGLFQAVADLVRAGELPEYESEQVDRINRWFNRHLDAPDRFARSRRPNAAPRAICWFKGTATEYVSRMHVFCHALNEHGIGTEMIICVRPGYIVFEDDFQVAAIPYAETLT